MKHIKKTIIIAALAALAITGCLTTNQDGGIAVEIPPVLWDIFDSIPEDQKKAFATALERAAKDRLEKLVEQKDREAEANPVKPVNPDAPAASGVPNLDWRFGNFRPAAPVSVWRGKGTATKTHVFHDFSNAPAWFMASKGTGKGVMFEHGVFWRDGDKLVGGKQDWINAEPDRAVRDLYHTFREPMYANWDGRFKDDIPAFSVIVNSKTREWMIYELSPR